MFVTSLGDLALRRVVILYTIIVPLHHTIIGSNSLEHKERNGIITDEWYILVKI